LWRYLLAMGADRSQLARLHDEPAPPAVIGLNYYVTSDRFLDDRLDRYPPAMHGGNGRQRYVDVDAVRVEGIGLRGHAAVLAETWHRYRRPVAITEAHLGCTREEQMRWLAEAWQGAHAAATQGADVRAVAAWALLGSWDWNSLLTRGDTNHYEAGAFDIRTGARQPTSLAAMIADLAAGREPAHPVLDRPGWWRRTSVVQTSARPMLIAGAHGTLGREFVRACEARGLRHIALARRDLDISNPEAVRAVVARWRPWAIVNAAGYVRVDQAEQEPVACRRANAIGPAVLAFVCRSASVQLVTFSSDLVFDGQLARPYVETDLVCPLNIYGRSKVEAERRVLALNPSALIIRTSAFFGPSDGANVLACALDALASGRTFHATSRAIVSPTYVPDLVDRTLDLMIDGAAGVWHLANAGAVSWLEFARMAAVAARLNPEAISDSHAGASPRRAAQPPYSVLGSERGAALPALDESLLRFVRDRTVVGSAA
jgi:dTDP-4-dehydrorhamnose reductase